MARTKNEKKEIIQKLEKIVDGAETLVFVNVHGLKVSDATVMRRKLRSEGVGLFIAKKTLTSKVLKEKNFTGSMPELVGEFAMAYGKDAIAPAREVFEFEKKFKTNVKIVGGVFEKKFKSQVEMTEIASIPSLTALRGMFVNVINSPIQGFVMVLDALSKKS